MGVGHQSAIAQLLGESVRKLARRQARSWQWTWQQGIDITWRNCVDCDAKPRTFLCQCLGETVNPRLRSGIVHLAVLTCLPIHAAYIDDSAKLSLAHILEGELAKVVARTEVCIDDCVPHVAVHLLQRSIASNPGIVHKNLDGAYFRHDSLQTFLAFVKTAHVKLVNPDSSLV